MNPSPNIRRLLTWAMLALYGLVVSGLPLPMALPAAVKKLAGKDRSRQFPCMDKACGCDSAERCLTSCCCHTAAETLIWAKSRGVEPAVIEALARRTAAASPQEFADGCSTQSGARAVHAHHDDDVDNAICSDYQSLAAEPRRHHEESATSDEPADNPAEREPLGDTVILRDAIACGGLSAQWAATGVALPPPVILTCDLSWPPVGRVSLVDERADGAGVPPDLPPPRA